MTPIFDTRTYGPPRKFTMKLMNFIYTDTNQPPYNSGPSLHPPLCAGPSSYCMPRKCITLGFPCHILDIRIKEDNFKLRRPLSMRAGPPPPRVLLRSEPPPPPLYHGALPTTHKLDIKTMDTSSKSKSPALFLACSTSLFFIETPLACVVFEPWKTIFPPFFSVPPQTIFFPLCSFSPPLKCSSDFL